MNREFLNPARKLVDEVADWLCGTGPYAGRGRVRTSPEGALALDHLTVVVPTAQSGRNLRLAIARRFPNRGVLPPRVVQPMQLVRPADETLREATPCEVAAAFQHYVKACRDEVLKFDCLVRPEEFEDLTARFALLDQLEDIWRALAGRGLLMREVAALAGERLASDFGDELRRWQQLGELETGFFAYLHERGRAYPTELVHAAKTRARPVPAGVAEVVVPALADPIRVLGDVLGQFQAAGTAVTVLLHADAREADRFDEWGWPRTAAWTGAARPDLARLTEEDIVRAPSASSLARLVAADCPSVGSGEALPSLVLCDDTLHQSLASAFLNGGYVIHNPERHLLAKSSLGRLLRNLIALYPSGDLPWRECRAVLGSSDVQQALGLDDARRETVLKGADIAQNAFLPQVVPQGFAFSADGVLQPWQRPAFDAFCETGRRFEALLAEARRDASLAAFLRRLLQTVFAAHTGGARTAEKEFLAAAEGARAFLAALESDFVSSLEPQAAEFEALARRELAAVAYSLEPDAAEAVRTEGWLELPWTAGDRVALAGLHEGKVPDSIVGHPFLPDALRRELGLVTNEDRLARDTWILNELFAAHAEHAVRAYVARTSDAGDICRPSRLLYLCGDAALPQRVAALFGDLPPERTDRVRRVEWPLALPETVRFPDHLSASALDTYVKCPFTYLLKYGLRMNVYRDKEELGANDFGTYAHDVLKAYADRQIARSRAGLDQLTDAREIRRLLLEELAPAVRARFVKPTLNVELQLKAAEGRLAFFAERQAEWAAKGWRIREAECALDGTVPELGVAIRGSIDRIDENVREAAPRHWCLIDYKTWDEKGLAGRVVTTTSRSERNAAQLRLAHELGLPTLANKTGEPCQRILSVQLPVYGKGYAAAHPDIPFADMQFSYFILGLTADQTEIGGPGTLLSDSLVDAALATARRAVELIRRSVFWPPGPTDEWKWDFPGLFVTDPRSDLDGTAWAKAQEAKREAGHV